jgi:hypothetical protein
MITLVDVKTNDHGGSGWMISGRLDRRRPNGCFRRYIAVDARSGEGRLFTRPRSTPLSREGPVWDQEELFLERG